MDEENEKSPQQIDAEQDSTTSAQGQEEIKKALNDAKEKVNESKTYQAMKQAVKTFILAHLPAVIIAIVGLIIIITFIGLLQALISMPGLINGKLKEFAQDILGWINGWLSGEVAHVTKEDEIELAQYVQDMGYDIAGYGFSDVEYERDSDETGETGFENGEIKELYDIDGKNYLRHYLLQNEAIYALTQWNLSGFFQSLFNNSNAESYGKGMINLLRDGVEYTDKDVAIDRDRKALRVPASDNDILRANRSFFYFQMDNWSSLYGKPLELFLALHIATMMPDLTYDLATAEVFNTKVNIELQEVKINYKVIISNGKITMKQEDIIKAWLKSKWGFTDSELSAYSNSEIEDLFKELREYEKSDDYDSDKVVTINGLILEKSDIDKNNIKNNDIKYGSDQSIESIKKVTSTNESIKTDVSTDISEELEDAANKDEKFDLVAKLAKVESTTVVNDGGGGTTTRQPMEKTPIPDSERESYIEGYTVEQLDELIVEIEKSDERYITVLWPRIDTVTKHWFYNTVKFKYGQAKVAHKKIHFSPDDTTSPLAGAAGVFLDAELRGLNGEGVYYQLEEPTATGPNDAIIALFKGGSGTLKIDDDESRNYDFPGKYYRYDGSRNTAKDIKNALATGATYQFMGKTYAKGPVNVEKEPVTFYDADGRNTYKNAYAAFAILENAKTLVAESAYRNLKELMIELEYFTEDELKEPVEQVLEWFMPGNKEEENLFKKPNEYGIFVKNSSKQNIIAPGDGEVIAVNGDSITIKFSKLNAGKLSELRGMFEDRLFTIKDTDIIDMQMVISGINPSVSEGQKITYKQSIGTASRDEVQVYMKYSDGSIVDDVTTYMDQKLEEPPKIDEIPEGVE